MIFDRIEWDEYNLDHATRHGVTATEIEQAIWNTDRVPPSSDGRFRFTGVTDGGRKVRVIAAEIRDGIRPISAWEV